MHNYWCVVLAVFCGCFIAAKADGMSCAFERKSLKNIEALLPLLLSAHWSIFFFVRLKLSLSAPVEYLLYPGIKSTLLPNDAST